MEGNREKGRTAMRLVNLTPHDLVVFLEEPTGSRLPRTVTIPKSGQTVRVASTAEVVGEVDLGDARVPLVETKFGALEGLPEPEEGTVYIVSALALQAAKTAGRTDVIAPDTGPQSAVRDGDGNILGVRRFTR